jgi:2'-5' RNA ligase
MNKRQPAYRLTRRVETLWVDDIDHVEWRKERERFAVWLVDADIAPVRERVAAARGWLADFIGPSRRQPHVTIAVAGFLDGSASESDHYCPARRARTVARLAGLDMPPFVLTVGGIDSFDSATFLRVDDPGGHLLALRDLLHMEGVAGSEPYVPHVTVGTYCRAFPVVDVAARLDGFTADEPIALPVHRITLAAFDARDIGGPLEPVESHRIGLAREPPPGETGGFPPSSRCVT